MKKIIIIALLILLILFIIFIILSQESNSLSDSQFVEIYVQLSILSEQYASDPHTFHQEKEKVFKQYKVTEKEFQRFQRKYQDQPEKWVEIWKKINKKLEEKLREVEKPKP